MAARSVHCYVLGVMLARSSFDSRQEENEAWARRFQIVGPSDLDPMESATFAENERGVIPLHRLLAEGRPRLVH